MTEIIDDETVKVKKNYSKEKAVEDLTAEGRKVKNGENAAGLAYKILPYVDQMKVKCHICRKSLRWSG